MVIKSLVGLTLFSVVFVPGAVYVAKPEVFNFLKSQSDDATNQNAPGTNGKSVNGPQAGQVGGASTTITPKNSPNTSTQTKEVPSVDPNSADSSAQKNSETTVSSKVDTAATVVSDSIQKQPEATGAGSKDSSPGENQPGTTSLPTSENNTTKSQGTETSETPPSEG